MNSTWKLFCRTMRVMGKRRFLYYGAILGMSIGMGMFSVLSSLMMKGSLIFPSQEIISGLSLRLSG